MCVEHIPPPDENAKKKVEHIYTGPMDSELAEEMVQCQAEVCLTRRCFVFLLFCLGLVTLKSHRKK